MKKSTMQIITWFVALACFAASLAACGTAATSATATPGSVSGNAHVLFNGQKKKGTIIKIGLDLPLSGTYASAGQSAENGALLAISQANDEGVPLAVPGEGLAIAQAAGQHGMDNECGAIVER